MLEIILYCILFLLLFVIVGLIFYARWKYGTLEGLGIPVIPPTFLQGSVPEVHKYVQHYEDIKRFEKYGPVWGLYLGRSPIIFIADPDLIKQIFVKDTQYFFDREPFDFGDAVLNQILDYLPGEKWKTMRVSQTKLFSSGKIKQYSNDIFKSSMKDFMDRLESDIAASGSDRIAIDARERFCTYTVDSIGRSMLSLKVEPGDNAFYKACQRLIGDGQTITSFYNWTLVFPFLTKFEPSLVLDHAMIDTFRELLASRRNNNFVANDYGDIMNSLLDKVGTDHFKNLGITETTVFGQAVNLFLAGFDRISTEMTFMAYHLAKNTDAQDRLLEEIDRVIDDKYQGEITYEAVAEMPFLTACISEASRLYPTFIHPERVCNQDWQCPETGIKIPKGVVVQLASWAVNRHPDIYENPHEFMPERFLPENKSNINPYAYSSFGFGHRNCIGMRFAYEAMRVAMCHMLYQYRFELRDDTKVNFKPGILFIIQYDPVILDVVKRNK